MFEWMSGTPTLRRRALPSTVAFLAQSYSWTWLTMWVKNQQVAPTWFPRNELIFKNFINFIYDAIQNLATCYYYFPSYLSLRFRGLGQNALLYKLPFFFTLESLPIVYFFMLSSGNWLNKKSMLPHACFCLVQSICPYDISHVFIAQCWL